MKKLLLLAMVILAGCAYTVPTNFKQRAISEFSIDVKLYSISSHYYPGTYGYSEGWAHSQVIKGILVCTEKSVLFVIPGRQKYDIVFEILYSDITDVLTPAWGLSRRLVIKCKSNFYTFDFVKGAVISREETYFFYKVISGVSKGISIFTFVDESH